MCIYIYIYTHYIYVCVYIYIYIHIYRKALFPCMTSDSPLKSRFGALSNPRQASCDTGMGHPSANISIRSVFIISNRKFQIERLKS